jgi:hypothetical protein
MAEPLALQRRLDLLGRRSEFAISVKRLQLNNWLEGTTS